MSLSDPRGQFGVHSVCFYNRDTGVPISYLRVLGECTVDFTAESVDLEGGSQQFLWDTEVSKIGSELSLTGREYNEDTMEILMGGQLTENTAEATGAVESIANVKGSSMYGNNTGIHTISVTTDESADLKEGKYVLKATAAQAATLYCMSDVDFKSGEDATYLDDDLSVATLDFSSGNDQQVTDFGLNFEVGSGTTAFTTNDTLEFYVRKPNDSSIELVFGSSGAEFSEFGVVLAGQKQSDGTVQTLELYKCKGFGMPISFTEKSWSEWSVTIKALYDSSKDAVGMFRRTIAA